MGICGTGVFLPPLEPNDDLLLLSWDRASGRSKSLLFLCRARCFRRLAARLECESWLDRDDWL